MTSDAETVEEYINQLPEDRKEAINTLRKQINDHIPEGFQEVMNYGMMGWVVPHERYPDGYHCDPKLPLPFMALASQKNHVAVYHSGVYADREMMEWFVEEYPKHASNKLNMGKSCIRFTNVKKIPFDLIGELASKMTVEEWIELYENNLKSK